MTVVLGPLQAEPSSATSSLNLPETMRAQDQGRIVHLSLPLLVMRTHKQIPSGGKALHVFEPNRFEEPSSI